MAISNLRFLFLLSIMLITGGIHTFMVKLQNIQVVDPKTKQKFFHPAIQVLVYFFGEFLIIIYYLIDVKKTKSQASTGQSSMLQQQNRKPQMPFYVAWLPAIMDICAMLLIYVALTMIDSSVAQMSRGGSIITTAILSRIILKQKINKKGIIGCSLAFLGILCVQASTLLFSKSKGNQSNSIYLGLSLMFVCVFFTAFTNIFQKKILQKYDVHPFRLIYLQGLFGCLFVIPLIIIFHYCPCPWSNKLNCVKIDDQYYLQNIFNYFEALSSNGILVFTTLAMLLMPMNTIGAGVILNKQVSPLMKVLGTLSRSFLLWGLGIYTTIAYGKQFPAYRLQSLEWQVNFVKLIGFFLLIKGILMYSNKNSRVKSKEKRKNTNQLNKNKNFFVKYYDSVKDFLDYDQDTQVKNN